MWSVASASMISVLLFGVSGGRDTSRPYDKSLILNNLRWQWLLSDDELLCTDNSVSVFNLDDVETAESGYFYSLTL